MIELLSAIQRQADAYSAEELHEKLRVYNVKSPSNKENSLTFPFPFNLMFRTTIGPEGTSVGFLRPETAQGLFVNFRYKFIYNAHKMKVSAPRVLIIVYVINYSSCRNNIFDDKKLSGGFIFPDTRSYHTFFVYLFFN